MREESPGIMKDMVAGNARLEKSTDQRHRDEPVKSGVKRGKLYLMQDLKQQRYVSFHCCEVGRLSLRVTLGLDE